MPEETNQPSEESFTFVDKRRASSTSDDENTVAEESTEAVDAIDANDGSAPSTTYQIGLYALGLLQMNAFQQLGLIADQATGKAVRDLAQARVAIDCVAALASVLDSPESTLEDRVKHDVRRVLTDLRLNFVTQTQMAASSAS